MVAFAFTLLILRELAFIASGVMLCQMAYKMFLKGVDTGGADEMSFGTYVTVKGGGPGIVFVCLGTVVIVYSISTAGRLEEGELATLASFDQEQCEGHLIEDDPELHLQEPGAEESEHQPSELGVRIGGDEAP